MKDETNQSTAKVSLLTCRFAAEPGMLYLAPAGVATPYESVSGLEIDGGRVVSVVPAQGLEQSAVVIAAEGAEVVLRYATGLLRQGVPIRRWHSHRVPTDIPAPRLS